MAWLATTAGPAAAQVAPVANPPIEDSCGVDVTLVLDASGSVQSSNAVDDVRDAAEAFLESLRNTRSTARVTQFATSTQELAPYTIVDDASLAQAGVHRNAIAKYYNPRPPLTGTAKEYRGGNRDVFDPNSWKDGSSNQYTNWDTSLDQANDLPTELLVYVTDGDPTAYDFQGSPDPFAPPTVGYRTDRSAQARQQTIDRAVVEANEAKVAGTRVLAVGVGSALNNQASRDRLVQISGPQVVRDADLATVNSLNEVDVALVTEFEDLAAFLRGVVLQLCSPSLTIRKLAQTADSADFVPAQGWTMTVTPEAKPPGTGFTWILPDTAPAASKSSVTDVDGFAQFQWEPIPAESDSRATVTETLLPDYTPGREPLQPGGDDPVDWRCELRDEGGNVRVQEGEFPATGPPEFVLDPIGQEIVTCTLWNSFDYQPAVAITKVNDPPEVRGDLNPPTEVTSSFVVTNPGNTPIAIVDVVDDRCSPEAVPARGPNVGDTDGDGLLDPDEQWQYTCTRTISTPPSTDPVGRTIVNTAQTFATTVSSQLLESEQVSDDVTAFNPRINVVKDVAADDGSPDYVDALTGTPPLDVVYRYRVTATGNTPFDDVQLTDDTAPCSTPGAVVRQPDAPGNDDTRLDLGETWVYTCQATLPGPDPGTIFNTATVSGLPVNPVVGSTAWYGRPNPRVSSTDTAEVRLATPGILLTKTATCPVGSPTCQPGDPPLLLLPSTGGSAPVDYTFAATNTGTEPLVRPNGEDVNAPGWIDDPLCDAPPAPVLSGGFNVGDVNQNNQIDPGSPALNGETWQFRCSNTVSALTANVAQIRATGVTTGSTVTDRDVALVDVARPAIVVEKTALRAVVVDPEAPAVIGPDVPRRPAEYQYEVINTGNVALDLAPDPPVDDVCTSLVFDPASDTGGDGLLDPGEVWSYTCEQLLDREADSNTPPVGGRPISGLVSNTVTVTGSPSFNGATVTDSTYQVTDTDTVQVLVIEPSLTLTKTASPQVVPPGQPVTYTFAVTNTGDVGLEILGIQDDKCAPLTFTGGDTTTPAGNGILDGANSGTPETWTYTCTRDVGLPEPPATEDLNEAVVVAADPLGNLYVAEASATVKVISPDINLTKTVSETLVPAGTPVTYTFEVTNDGQSPTPADDVLAEISLVDASTPAVPSCSRPDPVPNPADPALNIGDANRNGLLERDPLPGETWQYTCGPVTIDDPTTDVAVVSGIGGTPFNLRIPVVAFDAAFVQPFRPGIEVVKTADPASLPVGGGEVTYTYEVRNTGDVPLAGVAERITDDTCSPVAYVSGDEDNDGLLDTPTSIFEDTLDEIWVFTCTTTVTGDTTNIVEVTGTPTDPGGVALCAAPDRTLGRVSDPCDVDGTDTATVPVAKPGTIVVEKVTDPGSGQAFDFTIAGVPFSLKDGQSRTYDNLAPGQYTVKETLPSGWLLDAITCVDATGDTVVNVGSGSAVVQLADDETVTCTFRNQALPTLPQTGASGLGSLLSASAGLIGLGALMTWVSRRRRLEI